MNRLMEECFRSFLYVLRRSISELAGALRLQRAGRSDRSAAELRDVAMNTGFFYQRLYATFGQDNAIQTRTR